MSSVDSSTVLAALAMVVGVVVWLVRLEGRINTQSELHKGLVETGKGGRGGQRRGQIRREPGDVLGHLVLEPLLPP